MKKIVLALIATIMIAGAMMAQTNQKRMILTIASRSSTMGNYVKPGDFIYILGDSVMYVSRVSLGPSATGTYLLGNSSRYHVANMATYAGKGASYWVDTATAQNIHGVKTFYDAPSFAIGSNKTSIAITTGSDDTGGSVTTGNYNILLNGGNSITTGSNNIAIGNTSLSTATTSSNNIGIGVVSLLANTSGSENIGVGGYSLYANTTGVKNVAIGDQAHKTNTTGGYNAAFGYNAGTGNKSGSGNIFIGKNAGPAGTTSTASNKLYISNVVGGLDTALVYGDFNAKWLQINGALRIGKGITDTTITAAKGYMVFKSSDSTLYVCRSTTAAKKWYAVW